MIRTSWHQIALYGALTMLQKGLGFILLPITTRYLSVAEYGTLELIIITLTLASLFEISAGALPKLAADSKQGLLATAVKLSSGYGLLVALACLALIAVNPVQIYHAVTWYQGSLIAVCVWLMMMLYPVQVWLRIQNRADHYCMVVAAQTLTQAVGTLSALFLGWGIDGILMASVAANLTALVIGLYLLRTQWRLPMCRQLIGQIVSYQSSLIGASLALFVMYGLDRMVISHWLGAETLAHYGIMLKLTEAIAVGFAVFELWWGPKRYELAQSKAGQARIVVVHQVVLVLLMASLLIVCAIAEPILRWLLPAEYLLGLAWLPALLIMLGFRLATSVLDFGCYTQQRPIWLPRINAAFAAMAIGLYMWVVPIWSIEGLLLANVVVYGTRLVVFSWVSQRIFKLDYPMLSMVVSMTMCCLCLASWGWLPSWISLLIAAFWLLTTMMLMLRRYASPPDRNSALN
ncbi:oligosaccharide flippase family protein [Neiella marina]|uniref:Oligosaccharide flippase family protein n=1 Tax=Neiella holothuriorum TaxID=2870530 RepID=A0ABS7EJU2_9GAMM|nr:oligosaccharide flippase family protein [Neiella holothuriorum]MBW8192485.1 oligosaccharide flippase family protein [Neiella holothuriorum]